MSMADENSGSTAGLQKLICGPSSSAMTASAPLARNAHVPATRCKINLPGCDGFPVDASCAGRPARARQMLCENGRESRRHMLGDQHRKAINNRADFGDQGHQRLRTAGRRTDQQRARRAQGRKGRLRWLAGCATSAGQRSGAVAVHGAGWAAGANEGRRNSRAAKVRTKMTYLFDQDRA